MEYFRTPDGRRWEMTFSDEFEGTELDLTKWERGPEVRRQNAGGYWDDAHSYLDGEGHLVLKASLREDGRPLSGAIRSAGRFEQTYGYFEARMQLPKTTGYWGAFWVLCRGMGRGLPTAKAGVEIDIIESGECLRKGVNHAIHWGGYRENLRSVSKCLYEGNWYEGWHTYGMAWTKDAYIFYIDGEETWRTSEVEICEVPAYVKVTAEFGTWAGDIKPEELPDRVLVDWVRVYREVEE
ncbi:MAG: glycoside hydrolase family 16 protein [Clostridia bacterium]|nr:glycoside hydrolase family 16 protein [Clostridia bacterium]